MTEKRQIIRLAITSRILIIIWQAVSNLLLPDHDAGVFVSPKDPDSNLSNISQLIEALLGGFRRWDAEYFLHIAEHGYTYENTIAFYPLFPFCVRFLTHVAQAVIGGSFRETSLIVAVALNVYFFTKAATTLFDLTEQIFKDRTFARIATTLFCFNPASIFFSAPYTESLFAWMSFSVMLNCSRGNFLKASLPFMLGMLCRSNGIVNFGFILYYAIQNLITSKKFMKCFGIIFNLIVTSVAGFIALTVVQFYYFKLYCENNKFEMKRFVRQYGLKNDFVIAGEHIYRDSPWCLDPLPFSYSYVQSHYWNVGFLKYYEIKQIPQFLLAAPVLIVFLFHSIKFLVQNLGITLLFGLSSGNRNNIKVKQFVYVIHAFILSIFCLFFVHIQVSTRMLASSTPYLYWIGAEYFYKERNRSNGVQIFFQAKSKMTRLICIWFLGYFIVGVALFSNFLPWT